MGAKHMLKHHIGIPLAIMAVLLVVGVPLGTAFVVGMMAGCMSMMLMMMGGMGAHHAHGASHDGRSRDAEP